MHIDLLVLNYLQNFDDNFEYKISNSNHCSGKKTCDPGRWSKQIIQISNFHKIENRTSNYICSFFEYETISVQLYLIIIKPSEFLKVKNQLFLLLKL